MKVHHRSRIKDYKDRLYSLDVVNSSYRLLVVIITVVISIMMIISVNPVTVDHTSFVARAGQYLKGDSISQAYDSASTGPLGNNSHNPNNFVGLRASYNDRNYSQATSVKYSVNFTEIGLPVGVTWYVNLSNNQRMSSNTTYIETSLVNGSYSFFIGSSISSYSANGGVFSVYGESKAINITFFRVYSVIFTEVGVRLKGTTLGWAWTVNLSRGPQGLTFGLDIQFRLPNGTYEYKATSTNRSYYPEQPTGNFTVKGTPLSRNIVFNLVAYKVFFNEVGLPTGTTWCLSFNDTKSNISGTSLTFVMPNGTYNYSISTSSNYSSACSSGQVTVNGSNLYKNITFSREVLQRDATLSVIIEELILPALAVISIITFIYIKRRK
jgi:hypothetical protein